MTNPLARPWVGVVLPSLAARGVAVDALAAAPVVGGAREAAERSHAYWGAGARHVVVGFADGDWRAQVDVPAEARALLG
ncbi:hypothetical protein [Streptomyces buecherae]|uniref:hypothetical protein n=1 Tax=Streptomyces buecherae TaxID=2763006 RepID=UPI0036C2B82D